LTRMNGYGWAGVTVNIEQIGGPVKKEAAPSSEAERVKAMLRGILERRYNFETKLLDLSALAQDEELKNERMFEKNSTTQKFVPAMMIVLEKSFDKPEDKDAAILSVSLANNGLTDLTAVSSLSLTLPKLQNLDLSGNQFPNLNALQNWRKRFYHLQHLVLTGNPLEQNELNWQQEIVKWYPNLRQLNGVQVRTEEEIANKAKNVDLPFPIRTAQFQDEGGIAEGFVRTFFQGFDGDRAGLAAHYYDDQSTFSYAVNTQAPRDPNMTEKGEPGEWEGHLKNSRNLKKISQLPARQSRMFRGTKAVADAFSSMPPSKHPDLAAEARKWMIEAKMVPGVPDTSGASPTGVDGFLITIHGEFDELDAATGQPKKKRSFDRTFIVGPGGAAGVRIVSDQLTLRGYGGTQAFEPDHFDGSNDQAPPTDTSVPALPAGLDVAQAEQMVAQLMQQTTMTLQYAKDCLEQVGWNYQAALEAFERVKARLPADAFVQPGTA
jgi:nuclear RNA export factor